jgi:hypothetical protein
MYPEEDEVLWSEEEQSLQNDEEDCLWLEEEQSLQEDDYDE